MAVSDYKKKALIITNNYKQLNKAKKRLKKNWIIYRDYEYNEGKVKLPSIDQIFIIGKSKEEEPKWRRLLYRKGISIKITCLNNF